MSLFSRHIANQAKATDLIQALLLSYPVLRRTMGITLKELLKDHADQLKSDISVIAALDLLTEEGKVRRETSTGHRHPYDSIKIYPIMNGKN